MSESAKDAAKRRRRWLQFPLAWLFILVSLLCVLVGLASRHRQFARMLEKRTTCNANLVAIGLAMQEYRYTYGCFPPRFLPDEDGKPAHSWRALILPYIDRPLASQYRFDEPWDGPRNSRLASLRPKVFACPADAQTAYHRNKTNYFVVSGKDTAFPDGRCVQLSDFSDSETTILVVEAVGAGIDWLEPRDLDIGTLTFGEQEFQGNSISSYHPYGSNVAFALGDRGSLHPTASDTDISTLLSIRASPEAKAGAIDRAMKGVQCNY